MSALPAEAGDDAYGAPAAPGPARRPVPGPGPTRVRRPGLHVVPAMRRSRAPLAPFVAVVAGLLVLGLAALLGLNTVLAQDAFRIHDLEQSNARLAEREQSLRRELNTLESPATLAERAESLGMLPSSSPLFLRLPDGAVLGAAPGGEEGSADPDALAAVEAAAESDTPVSAEAVSDESSASDESSDEPGADETESGESRSSESQSSESQSSESQSSEARSRESGVSGEAASEPSGTPDESSSRNGESEEEAP